MAGRIRDSDIAEVRDRCRIDIVVGEYVNLGRAGGGTLKGLCPFHDEKTASFNVRPSKGTFHCFGCGVGGDVIQFVQQYEHIGFVEAVERLADSIGYRLTYTGGGATVQRDRGTKTRMLEAHKAAAQFYVEQLQTPDAVKAREFLTERGFDQAAADRFGCGFAPAGWDKLTRHLIGRGFELDELYKCGLAKEGRQGPIDRFHRRLLWPLKDLGGEVVGFGARRIFPDDPIEAKYVNTSETPIFKKSHVLFGIDLAKREIARRRQVVVVEGYTDVMAMHLAEVPTAVASCGTAFGADHISVLRRLLMDDDAFRGEVIFTFDGDAAGQKAALKAFDDEQKFAAQTFIAIAPDGMDPCELRQDKGDVAVRDLVARRQPLFAFAIRTLLAEHNLDTAEGRVEALRRTVPLVAQIKEESLRDEYGRQLAGWVGWDDTPGVLRRIREISGGKAAPEKTPRRRPVDPNQAALAVEVDGPSRPSPQDPQLRSQREVLKAAIQLPGIAGPAYDSISEEAFTHPAYLELHRSILAAGGTSCGLSGASFVDAIAQKCKHSVVRSLVTELAVESLRTRSAEDRYVLGLIANMQASLVARQIADIKSRLQRISPVTDADEYRALFGDLVAMEQYHKGLREQAMGGV
ncbi:DNA primase [Crossiella sp. CA-258035]|uniref:DNA primase n=1 Tax=Crossiella sp. CA-258035 TaxID=2981138 RepID=UPI0024BC1424|nr:DNA primase [Crossiella sp. CA-258035]WHT20940.1 DNA primase [Crossiella sp. CA-258035]